jgi:hypothetical protein
VLDTYAGYFILYQRLVACAGTLAPIPFIPTLYLMGSLVALVATVFFVFLPRVQLPLKTIAALALVCSPVGNEVFFGPTNIQWVLCLGLLLILVSQRPRNIQQASFDIFILLLLGLTGPYSILFLPLYLIGTLWYRDRWSMVLSGVCSITAVIQWMHMDTIQRIQGNSNELIQHARALSWFFGHNFVGPLAAIDPAMKWLVYGLAILGIAVYLALPIFAVLKKDFPFLVVSLAGPIIIASTLYAFRELPMALIGEGSRYYYVPTVTFTWSLVYLSRYQKWIAVTLLSVMAINVVVFYSHYQGPYFKDYEWAKHSKCLEREGDCRIPHPPKDWFTHIVVAKPEVDAPKKR